MRYAIVVGVCCAGCEVEPAGFEDVDWDRAGWDTYERAATVPKVVVTQPAPVLPTHWDAAASNTLTFANPFFGGTVPPSGLASTTQLVQVSGNVCSPLSGKCLGNPVGYADVLDDVRTGQLNWCDSIVAQTNFMYGYYTSQLHGGYTASSVAPTTLPWPSSDVFAGYPVPHTPVAVEGSDWAGISLTAPGGVYDQAGDMITVSSLIGGCLLEQFG